MTKPLAAAGHGQVRAHQGGGSAAQLPGERGDLSTAQHAKCSQRGWRLRPGMSVRWVGGLAGAALRAARPPGPAPLSAAIVAGAPTPAGDICPGIPFAFAAAFLLGLNASVPPPVWDRMRA